MKNENVNWVYKLLLFELIYTVQTTFRLFRFFFWPLYYVKHFFRLLHYAKCLLCSNGHYVHNDHFQSLNLPQRPLSSLFFLLFPPPSLMPLHLPCSTISFPHSDFLISPFFPLPPPSRPLHLPRSTFFSHCFPLPSPPPTTPNVHSTKVFFFLPLMFFHFRFCFFFFFHCFLSFL